MPRRRRFLLVFLAAVLAGLAFGVWLLWPPEPVSEINQEHAARIRPGMTLAEVEAILGGPARREGDGPIEPDYEAFASVADLEQHLKATVRLTGRGAKLWRSHRAMIWVAFNADGRVCETTWCPARFQRHAALELIRQWLAP